MNHDILTTSWLWRWILSLGVAVAITYILYHKENRISTPVKSILFTIRTFYLTILCVLLLSIPMLWVEELYKKPILMLFIDESTSVIDSMSSKKAFKNEIQEFITSLTKKADQYNIDLHVLNLQGKPFENIFNAQVTSFDPALEAIEEQMDASQVIGAVWISDGIINRGIHPEWVHLPFPNHAVLVGDTTRYPDISIHTLSYPEIVRKGNKAALDVQIKAVNMTTGSYTLKLKKNMITLQQSTIQVNAPSVMLTWSTILDPDSVGLHEYTLELQKSHKERNAKNNTSVFHIQVVDYAAHIVFVYAYPHPDIKALALALDGSETVSYDIQTIQQFLTMPDPKADLIVAMHPDPVQSQLLSKWTSQRSPSVPILYVVGNSWDRSTFEKMLPGFRVSSVSNTWDKVVPSWNTAFQRFKIQEESKNAWSKFPPTQVLFWDMAPGPEWQVVLYQKIGATVTSKPLVCLGPKIGFIWGEGIWQWRINGDAKIFDELFSKYIEVLAQNKDKRKFYTSTPQVNFNTDESIKINYTVLNDTYEKIAEVPVHLEVTSVKNKVKQQYISISSSDAKDYFDISGLPTGIYKYTAYTSVSGILLTHSGSFSVIETKLEQTQTVANANMLRNFALENGGSFAYWTNRNTIIDAIKKPNLEAVIQKMERYTDWIEKYYILNILLASMTLEWLLRKFFGLT